MKRKTFLLFSLYSLPNTSLHQELIFSVFLLVVVVFSFRAKKKILEADV